ncbi:type II toxin-antitoxin system RelE/ParE family toxin [Psychrosphaera algicola]|uniref:Type II toxin-antitoxin system RelE/ParE family toxin n=1 Tax=Psychrosphaera algicola TaxID=3023714 RepID=A0ABT5F9X3_9GAMM|nr:type II toxin-antitoxin system RelE/ParE family toxin [Psychrosphaera sp. G1-22]MDC2887668.1 type II toxin-antitoxin system RelE/ParE family toxin [Psychrosphaera sp. G1-22]
MAEIVWTQSALNKLDEIAEYIAVANLIAAKKLVQTVFSKIERLEVLEVHPESGKVPLEIPTLNYRELVIKPCRVFYKIDGNKVFILHVMRQEQDLRRFLLI